MLLRSGLNKPVLEKGVVKAPTAPRAYNTFLKPSTDQSEWLVSGDESFRLVCSIFSTVGIARDARILIPGVGLSDLPRRLYDGGFTNMVLSDCEQDAISHQMCSFKDIEHEQMPRMALEDLTSSTCVLDGYFDVIIDKSVLDVFIRQGGAAGIINFYTSKLQADGVLICFSMFHRRWKSSALLPPRAWYASIAQ